MRTTAITLLSSLLPLLLLLLGESTATGPSFVRKLGGALNDIVRDDNIVLHDDPLPTLHNAIRQFHADQDLSTTPLLPEQLRVPIPSKYKEQDLDRDDWGFPTQDTVRGRVWMDMPDSEVKEALSRRHVEEKLYHVALNRYGLFPSDHQRRVGQELSKFERDHPIPGGTDRASIKVRSPTLAPALDAVDNMILRLNALVKEYSPALRDKVAGDLIWLNEIAEQSITKTEERLPILKQYMSPEMASSRGFDLVVVWVRYAEVSTVARKILKASGRDNVGVGETS